MEIDLGTGIIAMVLIIFTIGPILYFRLAGGAKGKKFKAAFREVALEEKLQISQSDFWNNTYGIGIDPAAKRLLYVKLGNGEMIRKNVHLNQTKHCKATKVMDGKFLDRLDLTFTSDNTSTPPQKLEFFNGDEWGMVSEENELAEKWVGLVMQQVRK